jgi:hypothetical protein
MLALHEICWLPRAFVPYRVSSVVLPHSMSMMIDRQLKEGRRFHASENKKASKQDVKKKNTHKQTKGWKAFD